MKLSPIDYRVYFRNHTLYDAMVTDHDMNSDTPFYLLFDQLDQNLPDYFSDGMDYLLDNVLLDDYAGRQISNALASCYDIDFDNHTVSALYDSSECQRLMLQTFLKYHMKWQRIYDALYDAEYDPIANVDALETETFNNVTDKEDIVGSENRSISMGGTDTDSITIGSETVTTTHPTETVKNTEKLGASNVTGMTAADVKEYGDVAGFNSANDTYPDSSRVRREGSTANQTETSYTGTDQVTHGGHTDSHSIVHSDSGSNNLSYTGRYNQNVKSGSITHTRHGNIGVTMTQQLIEAEIDLRNKWQFYNIVINDVANELTLLTY